MDTEEKKQVREGLIEFLKGGFAPTVILLREFDHRKAHTVLEGLHFSAWSLLHHMHHRQLILLNFMRSPEENHNLWPDAHWPEEYAPESKEAWDKAIDDFEKDLQEIMSILESAPLFRKFGGKTIYEAALTTLHHNAYHIGQMKTIGRQLGVW